MKKRHMLWIDGCLAGFLGLMLLVWAPPVSAEWYAAGYGGTSTSGSFGNTEMNQLGRRQALAQFPNANDPAAASLTQSYKTSDIDLKNSTILGGKVGYFFTDEKLSWLGLELEAFSSKPSIKTQTLDYEQTISYKPTTVPNPCTGLPNPTCPITVTNRGQLPLSESSLRVSTVALNLIARYPGQVFQPYAGVGVGAFYFSSSKGSIQGRQFTPGLNLLTGVKVLVTDEWGFFAEGKYNLANVSSFDPTFGLSGTYSIFHLIGGVAYHF
ncbi:MAG: hypothetical protein ABL983_18185 [Nitrospira sp.]